MGLAGSQFASGGHRGWLHSLNMSIPHAPPKWWHKGSVADPIYGKFAGKTNAISRFGDNRPGADQAETGLNPTALKGRFTDRDWSTPDCRLSSASDDFAADKPGW